MLARFEEPPAVRDRLKEIVASLEALPWPAMIEFETVRENWILEGGAWRKFETKTLRGTQSPSATRRLEAINGLRNLYNGLVAGDEVGKLVWMAFCAGHDTAKAGQEDLLPIIDRGRVMKSGGGGRAALRGPNSIWAAVDAFVDQ